MGTRGGIFDIERENHAEWTALLNRIGIQVLLSGHMHKAYHILPGENRDEYGQQFVTVVGSEVNLKTPEEEMSYTGTAVLLTDTGIHLCLTDEKRQSREWLLIDRENPYGKRE